LERGGRGPFQSIVRGIRLLKLRKIVYEIRTNHLQNMSLKTCRCTNLVCGTEKERLLCCVFGGDGDDRQETANFCPEEKDLSPGYSN
jgi:hypothetical protein